MELIMVCSSACSCEPVYWSRKCYDAKTWKSRCLTLASVSMRPLSWLRGRQGWGCYGLHPLHATWHRKVVTGSQNVCVSATGGFCIYHFFLLRLMWRNQGGTEGRTAEIGLCVYICRISFILRRTLSRFRFCEIVVRHTFYDVTEKVSKVFSSWKPITKSVLQSTASSNL